jgi:activator of HSP90 ATPase
MFSGTIKQTVFFNAEPIQVYNLLMDKSLHARFTQSDVEMDPRPGGKFSVFDEYCTGENLELEPGKSIRQKWHFEEEGWPENHFSICHFLFFPEENKTRLEFLQTEIPNHKVEALSEGWKTYYWEPMKELLKTKIRAKKLNFGAHFKV